MNASQPKQELYDVFISYASHDRLWVEEHVYKPLQSCRMPDGKPPRVFYDRSDDSLKADGEWYKQICDGIEHARTFVPVFTKIFFTRPMCERELSMALTQKIEGKLRFVPIIVESGMDLPLSVKGYQGVETTHTDWFQRLCRALDLSPMRERLALGFVAQPPPFIPRNHTMPPVRVSVATASGVPQRAMSVRLSAYAEPSGSDLADFRGTLTVSTNDGGIAEFADLSLGESHNEPIRLRASADGAESVPSSPITIINPVATPVKSPATLGPSISRAGDAHFFAKGERLAIRSGGSLSIWSREGTQLGREIDCHSPTRLVARQGGKFAMAEWGGRVLLVGEDGAHSEWFHPPRTEALLIPGGLVFGADGDLFAGFWNGDVFRLRAGAEAELLFRCAGGVQGLAALGGRIATVDMAERLVFWENGAPIHDVALSESCIHLMRASHDSVLLAGERQLVKCSPGSLPFRERLHLGEIRCVLDSALPVIVDVNGRGGRFDPGLTLGRRFHIPAESVPVSADDAGNWVVFRQPDGAHIVMRFMENQQKIVHTHSQGSIAVALGGERFAVSRAGRTEIVECDVMERLISENAQNVRQ